MSKNKLYINIFILFIYAIIYTFYLAAVEDAWANPLDEEQEFSDKHKLINGLYVSTIVHTTIGF